MSASVRNKDDYVNAAVGGMLAGSVFGVKCEYLYYMCAYNQCDMCVYVCVYACVCVCVC